MTNETTTLPALNGLWYTEEEAQRVQSLASASKSAQTRRVYAVQFRNFSAFCQSRGVDSLPASPEAVALYVSELIESGRSVSTLSQALAAIKDAHGDMGVVSPTDDKRVKKVVDGLRRSRGVATHKKAAVTPEALRAMVERLDLRTIRGLRDRAVILLGFAGAFRRSELVALNVDDFEASTDDAGRKAYLVTVRRSKTDQEGAGMDKGIFSTRDSLLDPVLAVDEYRKAAGISSGALFRRVSKGDRLLGRLTGESVALIVKEAAARAGIISDLGAHSLRAGFVTTAINAGATERSIMNQTGHKSTLVMRGYQRRANALKDNAASGLL